MKFKVGNITKSLLPLAAGAVGASVVTGLVKKMDKTGKFEKFSPIAPIIIGGLLLSGKGKGKADSSMKMVGYGMMAGGAAKLAGNLIPGLAGIEDMDLSGVFGDMRIGEMEGTLNGEYDMAGASETLNGVGGDYNMSGYDQY